MSQSKPALPAFDDFADLLLQAKSLASPTDLQGVVCGRLSAGAALEQSAWHALAKQLMDVESLDPLLAQALDDLLAATVEELQGDGFSLDLLLPSDHISLDMRVESLAGWCSSFLHGFGTAGLKGDAKFSAEAAEALRDIASLAQVEADDSSTEQEAEANYVEVVEYLRMAVLTLYLEFSHKAKLH
ncbi:UPF0149 family protein [Simiduia aestuariiviva]|uniref:YecA family protein n=1 Tax=Simiduia aestuariiviva TaxID=1510459 RepID=A0A839UNG1_9GAMM|nr:UPF0149 family protein [Simiduia aestuariiviva]MBB3167108.1 hypothetical protein [Simiduia aestuariiviva]